MSHGRVDLGEEEAFWALYRQISKLCTIVSQKTTASYVTATLIISPLNEQPSKEADPPVAGSFLTFSEQCDRLVMSSVFWTRGSPRWMKSSPVRRSELFICKQFV